MKKRKKLLVFVIVVLLALMSCNTESEIPVYVEQEKTSNSETVLASEGESPKEDPSEESAVITSLNWMSGISDDTRLGSITIPGTHDSGANYDFVLTESTAKTQDLNIKEQLNAGVRHFDIRLCLVGDELRVHHGIVYQNQLFEDVWSAVTEFLDLNPSETIILAIQGEWTSEDNQTELVPYIYQVVKNDKHFFGTTNKLGSLTMAQLRGKVVITSRKKSLVDDASHRIFSYSTDDTEDWVTDNPQTQWTDFCKPALDNMKYICTNSDTLYSLWLNCYVEHVFGIPNIREASSVINPKFYDYIQDKTSADFPCVIVLDHMTDTLCRTIYGLNFK